MKDSTQVAAEKLPLVLTQVGAGNHKNSHYDTATAPSHRIQWHHYPRPGVFIT